MPLVSENFLEEVIQFCRVTGNLVDVGLLEVWNQGELHPLSDCPVGHVQAWVKVAEPLIGSCFEVPQIEEGDVVLEIQWNVDGFPVPVEVTDYPSLALYS